MLSKTSFLSAVLGAVLVVAPLVAAEQASGQTESVGANQTATVGANQAETTKHDAAKNAVNNIRAAVQEMKEQQQILKQFIAAESAPRAAYTKFKPEGRPVRAQADTAETKEPGFEADEMKEAGYEASEMEEGGMNSTIHKLPGRTKSADEPATASRADCRNNLRQLSLDIDKAADKLHRLSRQTKHKTFLAELKQLQTETRRLRAALKKLPAKPDEKADRTALAAISEAIEKTEAAADKLGRVKVQF